MRDIVIFGAGGAGKGALQIIRDINKPAPVLNFLGFLDGDALVHGTRESNQPVLGDHTWLADHPWVEVVVAIGNPAARKQVVSDIFSLGHDQFATLIHPRAWLSDDVAVGIGSIVYALAAVNSGSFIGDFALINMSSTLGHDTDLHSYATVAPGARVLGGSVVAEGAELGANSVVLPNITIGQWSRLGAGAVATRDIPPNTTAVGVPARWQR